MPEHHKDEDAGSCTTQNKTIKELEYEFNLITNCDNFLTFQEVRKLYNDICICYKKSDCDSTNHDISGQVAHILESYGDNTLPGLRKQVENLASKLGKESKIELNYEFLPNNESSQDDGYTENNDAIKISIERLFPLMYKYLKKNKYLIEAIQNTGLGKDRERGWLKHITEKACASEERLETPYWTLNDGEDFAQVKYTDDYGEETTLQDNIQELQDSQSNLFDALEDIINDDNLDENLRNLASGIKFSIEDRSEDLDDLNPSSKIKNVLDVFSDLCKKYSDANGGFFNLFEIYSGGSD